MIYMKSCVRNFLNIILLLCILCACSSYDSKKDVLVIYIFYKEIKNRPRIREVIFGKIKNLEMQKQWNWKFQPKNSEWFMVELQYLCHQKNKRLVVALGKKWVQVFASLIMPNASSLSALMTLKHRFSIHFSKVFYFFLQNSEHVQLHCFGEMMRFQDVSICFPPHLDS